MKWKIIVILCTVSLITGCSAFDKDTETLTNELFGNNSVENTSATEDVNSEGDVTEEDTAGDKIVESGDSSDENNATDSSPLDASTNSASEQIYSVGETSQIGFNSVICNLTVDNVLRGGDTNTVIDLYNSLHENDPIVKELSEGLEYCVIEYTLDLKDTEGITSVPANVAFTVKGNCETAEAIEVNGKRYTNFNYRYYNTDTTTVSSGDTATNKIIFVIPRECEKFSVELGENASQSVCYDLR